MRGLTFRYERTRRLILPGARRLSIGVEGFRRLIGAVTVYLSDILLQLIAHPCTIPAI